MGDGIKFAMYGVNFLFWMMGATMLGVGIWMAVDDDDAREALAVAGLNEDLYWTSVYFMIATGVFVFVVAFLGMFAAISKAKWALLGYIGVIGLAIIIQLNVIILTAIFWDSIDAGVEETMAENLNTCYVYEGAQDEFTVSWNNMQKDFKCCGSKNYWDYQGGRYDTNASHVGLNVPSTCCVTDSTGQVVNRELCSAEAANQPVDSQTSTVLYVQGCYPAMKDHLEEHSAILIALTCTFAILEISGIVIAFLLFRKRD